MPWRLPNSDGTFDPYNILVSEVMLQQTQVTRAVEKYQEFLAVFPSVGALAAAPLADVLTVWQGLGYNRRARFLREAAVQIRDRYNGRFPDNQTDLVTLPGIGPNTASAVLAYAYNQPVVFIETNIRSVFLHHFFNDSTEVHDKEILELVAKYLDTENPREWYWALMDYGSYLKRTIGNPNRKSKHYTKQSKFEGSARQIRGQILRMLTQGPMEETELRQHIQDDRYERVLIGLLNEQLIERSGTILRIGM